MQLARTLFLTICAFWCASNAIAESRQMESYRSIIDRNPFGLKDPVVKPEPTNAPPPTVKKEDFYLTGISTIGSKGPKAYLLAKDPGKKEYQDKFYNLMVGERQGDVLLHEIDAKGRRVRIAYLGEEKWLSMKDNGVPVPAGPAPGAHPAGAGTPGMAPPNGIPAPVPLPVPGASSVPNQPVSYPNASNMRRPMRNSGANYGAPGMVGTVQGGAGNANGLQGPQTDEDVARQVINMHAQHQFQTQKGEVTPPVPLP